MEVTKKLSEFVASTGFNDLPAEVINEAKLCFLDWLSVALGGANDPMVDSLFDVVELMGGEEQATVLRRNLKTSILNATLLNGTISHVLDFDDTSVEFLGHPSVTLFPCLLAVAEWKGKSGKEFLNSFVLGYEVGCRVAIAATANHYIAGWHGTSTIGHFSSSAGSARLLGLDAKQVAYALGTAGTQAAGIKAVFGTSCKPFHAGKAGFNGLLSALLAQRGFTSVENIVEGEKCFCDMFSTNSEPEKALEDLGGKWHIMGNKYKLHASCYGTHAPIETVLAIKHEYNIDPDKIEKIDMKVSPVSLEVAGKERPTKALEGKFSIPYCVANALLRGDTGIMAFTDEKINNPEVIALRDKVNMISDNQLQPFQADATIYVGTEKYEKRFDMLTHVIDDEEKKKNIMQKFRSLAGHSLGSTRTEEVIERVGNLEQESNMADFVALLV